jgi:hypothetical protein
MQWMLELSWILELVLHLQDFKLYDFKKSSQAHLVSGFVGCIKSRTNKFNISIITFKICRPIYDQLWFVSVPNSRLYCRAI